MLLMGSESFRCAVSAHAWAADFPRTWSFASQLQSKKGIARLSLVKRCTHPLTGYVKQPLPKLGHGLANDMVVHTILTFLPKNAMWREVG